MIDAARGVMRAVRLIGAVTPTNADAELARLERTFAQGEPATPAWSYARRDVSELERALGALDRAGSAWDEPLRSLYSARLDEMALEIALVGAVGSRVFGALAARRYASASDDARDADALTERWRARSRKDTGARVRTDSDDPRSLLSRVRAEIGASRAPFAVSVATNLGALAATGERTVYVARDRETTERAARRIAIHEVRGHVMPRVRAAVMHPFFSLGTARGADDQEGLALVCEERAGLLDDARKRELARRHRAATLMRAGADFVEVTRGLVAHGASVSEALAASARAFRGSDGRARSTGGLGRESVYLASFLRVRALGAEDVALLACGQIAIDALEPVRHWAGRHASAEPPPMSATV